MGAAACWALYIVYGRRVPGAPGGDAVAWGMLIAALSGFLVPGEMLTSIQ
jgi:inner membrane transporter RhtA